MIYLHYKDTKTFGHSFSFLLIFKTLRASYLQVGNFSNLIQQPIQGYLLSSMVKKWSISKKIIVNKYN